MRKIGVGALVGSAAVLGSLVAGCGSSDVPTRSFSQAGISFRYPRGWSVAGFSKSNFPPRLVVSSYDLPPNAVEGDCGGWKAVERLPRQGAYVILIDYGSGNFPRRPSRLILSDGKRANYECFGESTMFRFSVGRVSVQAHVGLGSEATPSTLNQALTVLTSLATT